MSNDDSAPRLRKEQAQLLRSYEKGPRIWDATAVLSTVFTLEDMQLIEPAGHNGAYQLTEAGRAVLRSEKEREVL